MWFGFPPLYTFWQKIVQLRKGYQAKQNSEHFYINLSVQVGLGVTTISADDR